MYNEGSKKLDAGLSIQKKKFKITILDNSETIYKKMLSGWKTTFSAKSLEKIIKNDFKFTYQDENLVSYARKIDKNFSFRSFFPS